MFMDMGTGKSLFQFTPLREGRLTKAECLDLPEKFQFTPLREGRPDGAAQSAASIISIHAPPRGATTKLHPAQHQDNISIHAPPRGATGRTWYADYTYGEFQFTPLREGRPAAPGACGAMG